MSFSTQELGALLPSVIDVARAAGRDIMAIYRAGFTVKLKGDRSPLTEADLAAQRTIDAGLKALRSDLPMLGEESAPEIFAQRHRWRSLWLVDPLDGTREFVKRNGEFTVNIALVHEHEAVLGVVYAPAQELLYAAARGYGAYRYDESGRRVTIHVTRPPPARLRVLGSRSHRDNALGQVLARLGPHEFISIGSALKFGLLAEGRGDFYLRLSPTCEWDTAAGQAVVTEAGGHVVDLLGYPLSYNRRPELTNPAFAAYADSSRDWLALLADAERHRNVETRQDV